MTHVADPSTPGNVVLPTSVLPVVLCGQVQPLGTKGHCSGIAKKRIDGPWRITRAGLSGDAQADVKNHGGPEKAVHQYPFDHYVRWRADIGDHGLLLTPGAFGENLSTRDWVEEDVHVGDTARFGSSLLQVSQGRQPCWKLNEHFGRGDMAYRLQMSGRVGWYYRVIEEGEAQTGDQLVLVDRPQPKWPLARLIQLLYRDKNRYEDLREMALIPELAESWRALARRRVQTRTTEDWAPRLRGQRKGPD